jgi:hypothetical protein
MVFHFLALISVKFETSKFSRVNIYVSKFNRLFSCTWDITVEYTGSIRTGGPK